jgi:hypothetical protein
MALARPSITPAVLSALQAFPAVEASTVVVAAGSTEEEAADFMAAAVVVSTAGAVADSTEAVADTANSHNHTASD